MLFVSWYISTTSKTSFLLFIFVLGSYFRFWGHIVSNVCSNMKHVCFMNYFWLDIGQQLINMTSLFVMLFFECFPTIFRKIPHALFKPKRPYKAGQNVYMGKNVPPMQENFISTSTDFDFSIEIFYKVRSPLTEALTLPRCFFPNTNTLRRCSMIPGDSS